jgi:hypothetical protein
MDDGVRDAEESRNIYNQKKRKKNLERKVKQII